MLLIIILLHSKIKMNSYCLSKFLSDLSEDQKTVFSCGEHLYITQFDQSTDRNSFVQEFRRFGDIRKIYIESSGEFAKVYFHSSESCQIAGENFKTNLLGWQVSIEKDSKPPNIHKNNFYNKEPVEERSMFDGYSNCQMMADQYVNVFGDPVELCQDDNEELFVKVSDVKMTGFSLFRRAEFDRLRMIDRNLIIQKEFNLFMLTQASNYLLNKMATSYINDEDIVETISRCRSKLGIDLPPSINAQQRGRRSLVNPYNNNISVRVDNQEPRLRSSILHSESFNRQHNDSFNIQQRPDGFNSHQRPDNYNSHQCSDGFNSSGHNSRQSWGGRGGGIRGEHRSKSRSRTTSFAEDSPSQMRPPKNLPNNFAPTHTQRFTGQPPINTRNTRQPSKPEEMWGSDPKPTFMRQESTSFDTQSQTSNSSGSTAKKSLLKRLEEVDVLDKVTLKVGESYIVRVTELEKDNICWVQETESCKNIDELLISLNDFAAEVETLVDIKRGQLALAEYEGAWCRCRVMNTQPSLNVIFIDYGNRADVTEIKELPTKFRKTPALACRLAFKQEQSIHLENDLELKVKVSQIFKDDTCLVTVDNSYQQKDEKKEAPKAELPTAAREPPAKQPEVVKKTPVKESPKRQEPIKESPAKEAPAKCKTPQPGQQEKHYFDVPEPLMEIQNGDKVMLIDMIDNKFAVKTKECVVKSKQILEYIKSLDKSELMLTSVKASQLVLCSKDGLPNLCRGVVKSKDSPTIVTVRYLDYSGEDQLSVKSLRNVDQHLAREPCTLLYTPEFSVLATLTDKGGHYVTELLEKKEKVKVVITEDEDFDLQLEGETLLSQKLFLLEKKDESKVDSGPVTSTPNRPKAAEMKKSNKSQSDEGKAATPKKDDTTPVSKKEEPVSYDDMPFIKLEVGSTGSFLCYNVIDVTEVTMIAMSDESLKHFNKVFPLEIDDDLPFEPEIMDMCAVSYQGPEEDEPSWYRAVVLDKEAAGYAVTMVDFGTQATVKSKDIRKFPNHLKDIPICGILCTLKDIPNNKKCNVRVKELLPEAEEVLVNVLEFRDDDLKYVIDIPDVTKQLKKEGLL